MWFDRAGDAFPPAGSVMLRRMQGKGRGRYVPDPVGQDKEVSYYLKLMKKMTKDYMAMNRYHNRLKAYQEEGKAVEPAKNENSNREDP